MPVQIRQLAQLRRPRYMLPLYTQMRALYVIGATTAYFSGIGLTEKYIHGGGMTNALIMALLTLLFLFFIVRQVRDSRAKPYFACDYGGAYIMYKDDKYAFLPWGQIRNITLDSTLMYSSPMIIVAAHVEDDKVGPQLAANFPINFEVAKQGAPVGVHDIRMAIPFRHPDPQGVLNRIYKMREGAGR